MKSRMAITSMLVLGVLVSGTGTGLAVSGVSDSGSAGSAQYPTTPTSQGAPSSEGGRAEQPDVLGKEEGGNGGGGTGGGGNTDVAGTQETDVQATRQVAVQEGDSTLPFTGFAAIPLILLGLALLVTGVTLRRRLPHRA